MPGHAEPGILQDIPLEARKRVMTAPEASRKEGPSHFHRDFDSLSPTVISWHSPNIAREQSSLENGSSILTDKYDQNKSERNVAHLIMPTYQPRNEIANSELDGCKYLYYELTG